MAWPKYQDLGAHQGISSLIPALIGVCCWPLILNPGQPAGDEGREVLITWLRKAVWAPPDGSPAGASVWSVSGETREGPQFSPVPCQRLLSTVPMRGSQRAASLTLDSPVPFLFSLTLISWHAYCPGHPRLSTGRTASFPAVTCEWCHEVPALFRTLPFVYVQSCFCRT